MIAFGAALWSLGQLMGALIQHRVRAAPSRQVVLTTWIALVVEVAVYVLLPMNLTRFVWTFAQLPIGIVCGTILWRYRRERRNTQ